MAQSRADLPVPLRARTDPHPYQMPKPNQDNAVSDTVASCHARVCPNPANAIEENPRRVEYEKTDVENLIHGAGGKDLASADGMAESTTMRDRRLCWDDCCTLLVRGAACGALLVTGCAREERRGFAPEGSDSFAPDWNATLVLRRLDAEADRRR